MSSRSGLCAAALLTLALAAVPAPAEVVEEIVAWVNGDIITSSELQEEEQAMLAEAYRRFTGEELDQQVEQLRSGMLMRMIDRKILAHYAQRLYDVDRMGEVFIEGFKEQQGLESDEQLAELAEADGMSVEDVRDKLIEMFAPEEVIRFEVRDRLAVAESEIETFYTENPESFVVPAEATLREIVIKADDESARDEKQAIAAAARQRVIDGEPFEDVARDVSEAPTGENGGELGRFKKGELSELLESVAFSIEPGTPSEVLDAPYGFHVLYVESRDDEHTLPLDEVRERIREFLMDRKFQGELAIFVDKARDEAEWCVKSKYQHLLDVPAPEECQL